MLFPRYALPLLFLATLPAGAVAATSPELDKKLGEWFLLSETEKPARYETLMKELEKSHSENPGDAGIIRAAAELSFARKDLGAAAKFYRKLLALNPRACDAYARLSLIAANGGDSAPGREEQAAEAENCSAKDTSGEQSQTKSPPAAIPSSAVATATTNAAPLEQASIQRQRGEWLKDYTARHPELDRAATLSLCQGRKSHSACAWENLEKEKLLFPEQIAIESSFMLRSAMADRKTGILARDEALLAGGENILRVLQKDPNYPIRDREAPKAEEHVKSEDDDARILWISHKQFSSIAIEGIETLLEQLDKEFPSQSETQKARKEAIRAGIKQFLAK